MILYKMAINLNGMNVPTNTAIAIHDNVMYGLNIVFNGRVKLIHNYNYFFNEKSSNS